MKRAALILGILSCALTALGGAVIAANPPARAAVPATSAGGPVGYAGKITAIRPPGDWARSGGPPDTRAVFTPAHLFGLPIFGNDINIGGGNETSIAANPLNPLNFVAGANTGGRFTTTDGGQTWNSGSLSGGGDPAVAFDAAGRVYYAQLGNTSTCPDNPYVYKSTDGGLTWGGATTPLTDPQPTTHFFDKEWIVADNQPASPHFGRIYVTASDFHTPAGCPIFSNYIDVAEVLAYSDNQGATWSSPYTVINDASHNEDTFTNPVVASDGTLYVSYQYQNCTYNCTSSIPMYQMITKSTDGGVSFSPSITVTNQPISPTGAFMSGYQQLYAASTSSGFRHNDQEIIGVAPGNPNVVYSLWTDGRWDTSFVLSGISGQHADIAFSRSTDGGSTWSAPIKVNDTPNGDGTDQFFPWMVVGSDGTIHASWMDRRAGGFAYREYYSQSTDGGLTWAANIPVADAGGTPSSFIGDYSGLAVNSDNTLVLPLWTDQRSGQRVYTDRGVLPLVTPTSTATALPPTATASTTPTSAPPTATSAPPSSTPTTVPASATPIAASPTATACAISFSDVFPTDYFYEPVRYLYCHGVISGYGDGTFRPYNNTTRAQMVKIVVLGFGIPVQTPAGGAYTFHDVDPTNPFFAVIETAAAHQIVSGYNCGPGGPGPCDPQNRPYFLPNNSVTRGQLSKIDAVAAGWPLLNPPTATFTDVPPGSAFYTFVETAVCHGVISGYADHTFHPGAEATRGQISKIVYLSITEAPGACAVTPAR